MPPSLRVPVTIVTGALGAGKTTLLRWLLTAPHGLRIAVIENEFGESRGAGGIESLVLKDGVGGAVADGFYELANGCVCCTVRDSLVQTLQALMARPGGRPFDYVLVETSGLADPGPVAAIFWSDLGDAAAALQLDGVVAVVDALHVGASLDRPRARGTLNEARRQIATADVVLLNKMDLVDAQALAAAEARVRGINAGVQLLRVSLASGAPPLERVLGLRCYDDATPPALPSGEEEGGARRAAAGGSEAAHACGVAACGHEHAHAGEGAGGAGAHAHDPRVSSVLLSVRAPVHLARFKAWIGELLWEHRIPAGAEEEGVAAAGLPRAREPPGAAVGAGADGSAPTLLGEEEEGEPPTPLGEVGPPTLLDEREPGPPTLLGEREPGPPTLLDEREPPMLLDEPPTLLDEREPPTTEAADAPAHEEALAAGGLLVFRGKGVLLIAPGTGGEEEDAEAEDEAGGRAPALGASGAAVTTAEGPAAPAAPAQPFIFQAVHALFDCTRASGAGAEAVRAEGAGACSRLLLIGEGLDRLALQRSFEERCV